MLLYDRNIIGASSEIFGNLRKSSVIFRKSTKHFRKRSPHLQNNFGKSSEILGKWSEIFGKSSKTSSLVCLCNKQNITCPLVDMNFIFSCSTRHLTRSLRSLVRYRVEHSKIKFISTHGHVISSIHYLRAVVSNYWESVDSCKNSNFFFFHQKIPLGKLFSKTIFKGFHESPVWRKIEKFEIWVKQAETLVKIMQIRAFSKRSYKTTETCFCLKFTGFVTHFLKLLSTYI